MSELEVDFEKVCNEINAKIKKAAKAMKEANEVAKAAGLDIYALESMCIREEVSEEDLEELEANIGDVNWQPLFSELRKAGWSTSSMRC